MTLEQRWSKAIRKIGGAEGLLDLPEQVKAHLKRARSLKTKVQMLELIGQNMDLIKIMKEKELT